jgi:hypothetical protein
LQAYGVAEGFGDLRHALCLLAFDVGVYDGLAAPLARSPLCLWGELQIDDHQYTYIH